MCEELAATCHLPNLSPEKAVFCGRRGAPLIYTALSHSLLWVSSPRLQPRMAV